MKQWLFDRIIVERFNNLFGFIVLLLTGIIIALAIAFFGLLGGIITLGVILMIPVLFASLRNNSFAFFMMMIFSTFMGFLSRVLYAHVPWGSMIDVLLGIMIIGIIIEQAFSTSLDKAKGFNFSHPISVMMIIWTGYLLLQVFNPFGTVAGYLFGLRDILRMMMLYVIAMRVMLDMPTVHRFVRIFIWLGLICALYGLWQEFVGLPPYDFDWATSTPERANLLFIQQRWRKFSFLSDPGIFGLFMSFGALVAFVLSLGPFSNKRRAFFFISGFLMLFAMVYTGTRTAYAIIPVGVSLYVLLNITDKKTLIFAGACAMLLGAIYFGPFYGKEARRIRSAFDSEDDASMNLRDNNRAKVQPYIHSHPIGGGLTTTGTYGEEYSPGHPMAGFPPDSGFLETLLEAGWIGLIIELSLYAVVLITGVKHYFQTRDPVVKSYYAAFITGFFALTIGLYAKDRIDQFPINYIMAGIYVLMYRMRKLSETKNS